MSSRDENPFDQARREWKSLSADRGWFGIFGEMYIQRYPFLAGMTSGAAASIKRSLAGDDSVHAFDASGIRQTIISRALETEGRGQIRPWYAQLGFVADATNFIKGITEDELDFIVRRSYLDSDNESINDLFSDIRKTIVEGIDPSLEPYRRSDGELNQFELEKLIEHNVVPAARPIIEMYGFLSGLTNHLFTISDPEVETVIDILLDPEKADKYLRRRFVGEESGDYPFVGEQHPRLKTHENMLLEQISCGDELFYKLRITFLWLYALLRDDRRAKEHFNSKAFELINDLKAWLEEDPTNHQLSHLIIRAANLAKYKSVYSRLLLTLRTDYAKSAAYTEYANRLFHLFEQRDEVVEALKDYLIPIDTDQFEIRNILIDVGLTVMEADIEKLESQIPLPVGSQEKIQGTIMSRRKANLRKEILDPVRDELLQGILEIENLNRDTQGIFEMGQVFRRPHIVLSNRGETYFIEMEERVQEQLALMGDTDLKGELQYVTDTPQVLVKQFGKEIFRWATSSGYDIDSLSPSDIYAGILALKSTELMFGDATTNVERRHEIAKSLFEEYFAGQATMMRDIKETYFEQKGEAEMEEQQLESTTEGHSDEVIQKTTSDTVSTEPKEEIYSEAEETIQEESTPEKKEDEETITDEHELGK